MKRRNGSMEINDADKAQILDGCIHTRPFPPRDSTPDGSDGITPIL